jgi:hypothetical protein
VTQSQLSLSEIPLKSPLAEITDEQWTKFVRVMMIAPTTAVSPSNALGAFSFMPRRLVDLNILSTLKRTRSKRSGRTIWASTNQLDHARAEKFLRSITLQYKIFVASMKDYASKISSGAVKLPSECTMSGALALCHRAGFAGLGLHRFPKTQEAFTRANGIF